MLSVWDGALEHDSRFARTQSQRQAGHSHLILWLQVVLWLIAQLLSYAGMVHYLVKDDELSEFSIEQLQLNIAELPDDMLFRSAMQQYVADLGKFMGHDSQRCKPKEKGKLKG